MMSGITGETGMSLVVAVRNRQTARRLAECFRKWRLQQGMSDGRLLTDGNAGRLVKTGKLSDGEKWLEKRAIDETKEVPEEVQLMSSGISIVVGKFACCVMVKLKDEMTMRN